jgi:hypothetical protein
MPKPMHTVPMVKPGRALRLQRLHPRARFQTDLFVYPLSNAGSMLGRPGPDGQDVPRHSSTGFPCNAKTWWVTRDPILESCCAGDPVGVADSRKILLNV